MIWLMALALGGELSDRLSEMEPLRTQRLGSSAPAIPAAEYEKVAAGQVATGLTAVSGSNAKKAWGALIVDVPIADYYAAINDGENKVKYTKLTHFNRLSGEACGESRVVFQYLPVPLMTDRWWVVSQTKNTALFEASGGSVREMVWKNVPDQAARITPEVKEWADAGMSVKFTEGAWFLVDVGGGKTLVEYYTWSDPGGNIPAGLASSLAAGGIEDTIVKMGKLAKLGSNCALEPSR